MKNKTDTLIRANQCMKRAFDALRENDDDALLEELYRVIALAQGAVIQIQVEHGGNV